MLKNIIGMTAHCRARRKRFPGAVERVTTPVEACSRFRA
jgi:hypothetical protein